MNFSFVGEVENPGLLGIADQAEMEDADVSGWEVGCGEF